MPFGGVRGTGDWGTDERPTNFRELILWRKPNGKAPLTALMGKARSEPVDDGQYSWWDEELNPVRVLVNGVVTTVTHTTIVIDGGNALDLVAGDVLLVEKTLTETASVYAYDNEIVVVSANPSSATTFVVDRGQAGSTAALIPDNSYMTKIGNIYSEGSSSPEASSRNPTKHHNFCQIFKTAYRITESAKVTKMRTGDPLKNDKKRKMFDHSVALEYSLLFGRRFETTDAVTGKPRRFTGGLLYHLAAEDAATADLSGQTKTHVVKVWTTTMVINDFFDSIYQMWDYDDGTGAEGERLVLAGNGWINALNKMCAAAGTVNYGEIVKAYGMKLTRYVLPQGEIFVKSHPLMNVHPRWTNDAFMINVGNLYWRYMRDTRPQDNIQAPDADEQKGQWLTEAGLEAHHVRGMQYHARFGEVYIG